VGTPGYMSPEQATGVADVRSDIYSLGAVGYFLLTKETPFSARRMQQILPTLALQPTPLRELRPEVPADLEAVLQRCLRDDPRERFADIQQVDQALSACACAASWSSAEAAAWWDQGKPAG
jgi:eukaryotic-like serine/threonine-protein kinase